MLSLWNSDAERSVRVVQWTESEDKQQVQGLVRIFEGIAAAEGWEPGEGLRLWQHRSVYFGLEVRGQVAGGLQLVLPDNEKPFLTLPCQSVWPEVGVSAGSVPSCRAAHIVVLALEEAVRGEGILFWNVVIEMWRYCIGEGITTLFIEVTPRVLPLYRRLGWPLVIQGDLRRHWGEDCYLCSLGIPEVAEVLLRRAEHSPYYRQIIAQAFRVTFATPSKQGSKRRRASPLVREQGIAYSYAVAA